MNIGSILDMMLNNIFFVETLYLLAVVIPFFFIWLRVRDLYSLTKHKGLRYFCKAFLFFIIAFFFRYISMMVKIFISENETGTLNQNLITLGLEFFMIVPAFFLLQSLIWKRFEDEKEHNPIFRKSNLIYVVALTISIIDYIIGDFLLMYITQIVVFSTASIITYKNYRKSKKTLSQMFFLSMLMFLFVWSINFIAQYNIDRHPSLRIYAYVITAATSFLLFYIVDKLSTASTKKD